MYHIKGINWLRYSETIPDFFFQNLLITEDSSWHK